MNAALESDLPKLPNPLSAGAKPSTARQLDSEDGLRFHQDSRWTLTVLSSRWSFGCGAKIMAGTQLLASEQLMNCSTSRSIRGRTEDDPRDPRGKIFFLYDVTDVHNLRCLLDVHRADAEEAHSVID
jgi:hypothetical protein